jgi:hypothetical protein
VAAAVAVYMVETTTTAAAEETANPLLHRRLSQLARSLLYLHLKWHALAAEPTLAVDLIAGSTTLTLPQHGGARSASQTLPRQRLSRLTILLRLETTSLSSLLL